MNQRNHDDAVSMHTITDVTRRRDLGDERPLVCILMYSPDKTLQMNPAEKFVKTHFVYRHHRTVRYDNNHGIIMVQSGITEAQEAKREQADFYFSRK